VPRVYTEDRRDVRSEGAELCKSHCWWVGIDEVRSSGELAPSMARADMDSSHGRRYATAAAQASDHRLAVLQETQRISRGIRTILIYKPGI
jgi:hypothetical protein